MRALIAGNWKMNGLHAALDEVRALPGKLERKGEAGPQIVICPPATLLAPMAALAEQAGIETGGQDCHPEVSGAHTGDISAEMLADAGAKWCIVGHSERRADHGETDALVRTKAEAAQRAGLTPIVCVGETRSEREAGRAEAVVARQLEGSLPGGSFVVAYEPVWAIGTGMTPTEEDVAAMHASMRGAVGPGVRLVYGGSVKPGNAAAILSLPEVGGALIGGASLKAADLAAIANAA